MKFGVRELVFAVLLLGIPLGAWKFIFVPRNQQDSEMRQQIEAKQQRLRAVNFATATIGDLQKQISALQQAIGFFQSKLPNEKEIDKVLQEVWQMAESNRMTTKSIRTLQRSTDQPTAQSHCEQPISMQLEGDFAGLYAFLQALENQPRIMRIRDMTLKKMDKGPPGAVQVSFVMTIFFESERG